MPEYNLDQTKEKLIGPSIEQITCYNQWAAAGFDKCGHLPNKNIMFNIDGTEKELNLAWDANYPEATMRENRNIAENGAIAMAFFTMSVLLDFKLVIQSEIGEGVDYAFFKDSPTDDLNFFKDAHFVEISGLIKETRENNIDTRLRIKHNQIRNGLRHDHSSSVIITSFESPKTVKEVHHE